MRPTYNTTAANLRAAEVAMAELPHLTGEAKKRQQERVNELVRAASMLNEAYYRANRGIVGRSQLVHSTTPVPARSAGHTASSPGEAPRQRKEKSVDSGRNKQMITYDPAMAQGNPMHAQGTRRNNAQGNENQENEVQERQVGQRNDNGGKKIAPQPRRGTHLVGGGNPMSNNTPA